MNLSVEQNGIKHIFMLKFKISYLPIKSSIPFQTLVCGRSRSYMPNVFTVQTLFKVESTGKIFTSHQTVSESLGHSSMGSMGTSVIVRFAGETNMSV